MELIEKTRKRLIINIPDDLHARIKEVAENRNMTIKSYVTQAILSRIRKEKS